MEMDLIITEAVAENTPLLEQESSSQSYISPYQAVLNLLTAKKNTTFKCWACWETFSSASNPLIRVCQGCKDPELQYIHQECIDSYISSLPQPRRPRSPRPRGRDQQSVSEFLAEEQPPVVLYDCTRCRDPYTVEERPISPFIIMWQDVWLRFLAVILTIVSIVMIGSAAIIIVFGWDDNEVLAEIFGLPITVVFLALLLTVIGLIGTVGLWIAIWMSCTGKTRLHVVGQPLIV
ncbi:hypothetical protein HDV01_007574 [Terramyces sp. JEL0728]|nr:hypothetical protein HDV01_007574 [Terramyces sp. JEL0728]